MTLDDFLQRMKIDYDKLNSAEKQTYQTWYDQLNRSSITLEHVKEHIVAMRQSVEQDLTRHDLPKSQDLYLKARLRNYLLLEALLTNPERAKKALEDQLGRLANNQ